MRGVITGFLARPTAKTSIGKVFQDRAARYGDKPFIKFDDETLTYREANETVNRYAAVLAARGVGHGDVVGVMLRNSPHSVLLMLAVVKCGAVAGMLNYHQRGKVLAHSIGLLDAKAVVAETDFVEPISESGADADGLMTARRARAARRHGARPTNPATTAAVLAKDKAFYIFTSGTTGMPKASVMTHYRWLRALAGFGGLGMRLTSRRHPVLLPAALPQQRADGRAVVGAQLGCDAGAGQVVLGVEVLGRRDPLRRDRVRLHRRDLRATCSTSRPKPTDRKHQVRVIAGNGLRPAIWDEFTERFGIERVCEFYAASEGNTAFINVFNVDKTHRHLPDRRSRSSSTTTRPADPTRDDDGRVRKVEDRRAGSAAVAR